MASHILKLTGSDVTMGTWRKDLYIYFRVKTLWDIHDSMNQAG